MRKTILVLAILIPCSLFAQDDLLSLLGEDQPTVEYAKAGFKTTRVINAQSFENTAAGVLDVKIAHRFGFLNSGPYELWGLDNATIRLGLDYGVTDRLMVGIGRSSFQKTFDGFFKYKLLRQSSGAKNMPVTLSWFSSVALNSQRNTDPRLLDPFDARLSYVHQLILGRKFSENFSAQVMPTMIHRNLVTEKDEEKNSVIAVGGALRYKLTKRVAINTEYFYVAPDQLGPKFRDSFSVGFDIETGGHVFQLHFTNSTSMIEKGFIAETVGNWEDGDVHFGFNIARVFTVHKPKPRI
jgi:opacity protein-like surface antigen